MRLVVSNTPTVSVSTHIDVPCCSLLLLFYVASHMHALRKELGVGISSNEIYFTGCKTTQPVQEVRQQERKDQQPSLKPWSIVCHWRWPFKTHTLDTLSISRFQGIYLVFRCDMKEQWGKSVIYKPHCFNDTMCHMCNCTTALLYNLFVKCTSHTVTCVAIETRMNVMNCLVLPIKQLLCEQV